MATPGEWLRANLGVLIASIAIVCLAAIALVVVFVFRVQNISVEGNVHYTSEEIEAMVLTDRLSYNSLYLSLKYRNKEIRDIPFIETMSVRVDSPDSITIRVYEKSVAGYVEYMGRYMYFDRDGIVVESSETRTEGIPQVTGIRFDHVVLYEALPVKNTDIFQEILSITQMLSKHQITTDKIYFNESNEITLYFDNIRAKLGKDNLEEKVMRLEQILPNLSGESGVLDLQNYSEDRKNVTFQKDG
ncbi:cell division protein FtsQ [Firmicutes bacterium AF16-15]|nr:FtsQ-type POTRA domain-containing protein [Lachnospiraceae bacterium]RGH07266.1 cell division protein FtsQ [Firmicutes bacterium AF16-15]RHP02368.1 cell division protein FtsQ [Firmicutes bacterium AF36-19BH]